MTDFFLCSLQFGVPAVHTWILPNAIEADDNKTLLELINQHKLPQGYGEFTITVVMTNGAET